MLRLGRRACLGLTQVSNDTQCAGLYSTGSKQNVSEELERRIRILQAYVKCL